MPRLLDHLDDPGIKQIVIETGAGQGTQLGVLLEHQDYVSKFEEWWDLMAPKGNTVITVPKAVETPAEPEKPIAHVLEPCQVVSFRVRAPQFIKDWMENKTYRGILFKWAVEDPNASKILKDVWPNQKDPYICTETDFQRFIAAMMVGLGDYYAQPDCEVKSVEAFSMGAEIYELTKKPGYILQDRSQIFYAKKVPWEKLAEKGVIKK